MDRLSIDQNFSFVRRHHHVNALKGTKPKAYLQGSCQMNLFQQALHWQQSVVSQLSIHKLALYWLAHRNTHTHTHILALDSWLVSPSRSMCVPAERLDETLFFGSVIRLIILHCQPLLTFTQTGEPVQVSKQASK